MLTEERYQRILETVNQNNSVTLSELCLALGTSESTIRRDLAVLDEKGMLIKVRGGAIAIDENINFLGEESPVEEKSLLFNEEKEAIAKFAATLIKDNDFVFIDAGTTTGKMIDHIRAKNVTFVTDAFVHAKRLAQRGFRVFLPGGEIKLTTEAIVGVECIESLVSYNFTKSFLGTNGISIAGGFSTPDPNEAGVKRTVINVSREVYVLADHSKFDKISAVTFAPLVRCKIITDRLNDKKYLSHTTIKEVM